MFKVPVLVAAMATTAAADPLDTLPSGYASVTYFAGAGSPLIAALQRMPDAPRCIAKVFAPANGTYQLNHLPETAALIAFRGAFDRAAVEACVVEAMNAMRLPHVTVSRDGALTVARTDAGAFYLGWAGDWVYHAKDRAKVEEALAHRTVLTSDKVLMAAVNKADQTQPMWAASAGDYTSKPLGVASTGMYLEGDIAKMKVAIHLSYASVADAKKAIEAVGPRVKTLPPALRELAGALVFTRKGSVVSFDPLPVFKHMDLMEQAMKELQK